MSQKTEINFNKAIPYFVTPARLRRMLDGEITALYLNCELLAKASMIMDYTRLGTVHDASGDFCPKRGEWLDHIESCSRNGAYAHYQSGKLKCAAHPTISIRGYSDMFYIQEKAAELAAYGLPKYTLYQVDQMPPHSFSTPIVKIRVGDRVEAVKWKTQKERYRARLFLLIKNITIKPAMDVTEDEAIALGFTPTDEPINLQKGLTLTIDEGETARNGFFADYYKRFGDKLRNDPYIHYIEFEIIKR